MVAYIVWRKVRAQIRKVERITYKTGYFIRKIGVHTRKITQTTSTGSAQLLPLHIFYCMLIKEIIFLSMWGIFIHGGTKTSYSNRK
jgi:hypothetical protein